MIKLRLKTFSYYIEQFSKRFCKYLHTPGSLSFSNAKQYNIKQCNGSMYNHYFYKGAFEVTHVPSCRVRV